jgi:hypothetical protein
MFRSVCESNTLTVNHTLNYRCIIAFEKHAELDHEIEIKRFEHAKCT